jgi:chromosomal replication initiation ATPase DnaA
MPRYTFDSFVVNDASREAFDAAMAVAHNSSAAHNPLVLFGPTRSGKTHLLYAIEGALFSVGVKVMREPIADFVARCGRRDAAR